MSTETFALQSFPAVDDDAAREAEEAAARRGYAAGFAAGARAAEEDAARLRAELREEHRRRLEEHSASAGEAVAVLRAAARALSERTVPTVEDAQEAVAEMALELAEAILGFALADRETAARAALGRALSRADGARVQVRLNPQDVRVLETLDALPGDVPVVPDATLSRGDAVADLEHGFVDARLGRAVARARVELAPGDLEEVP